MNASIPQIIAIVKATKAGAIGINKRLHAHLELEGDYLYIADEGEITISGKRTNGSRRVIIEKGKVKIPEDMLRGKASYEESNSIAIIDREDSLALKTLTVGTLQGEWAGLVEHESTYRICRELRTNPAPEDLLERLTVKCKSLCLDRDPLPFLRQREGFQAWFARRLLGIPDSADHEQAKKLADQRLACQQEDGSWESAVLPTAQMLKELLSLGIPASHPAMRHGAEWLLSRPQSECNPGMFFLEDALVAQQAFIIESRRQGKGGRFRQRRAPEIRQVRQTIPVAHDPCGPRIMWPNALVTEVLLQLSYESHPRLQDNIEMLLHGHWCECGYQHGVESWRDPKPMDEAQIEAFEMSCKTEFQLGGFSSLHDLEQLTGHQLPRTSVTSKAGERTYTVQMLEHLQPCEMITALGLSNVRDPRLKKLARAYLWRFAGRQHQPDGTFSGGGQKHVTPYFFLELFSRYPDHPAARIGLLRMLPWIIENQNPDGSWGQDKLVDAATLAVIRAVGLLRTAFPNLYSPDLVKA